MIICFMWAAILFSPRGYVVMNDTTTLAALSLTPNREKEGHRGRTQRRVSGGYHVNNNCHVNRKAYFLLLELIGTIQPEGSADRAY